MPRATGTFKVTSWNGDAWHDREGGRKLTHASGDQAFSGAIDVSRQAAETAMLIAIKEHAGGL